MENGINLEIRGGDLVAYNEIKLYGGQTCDYLYIQSDAPDEDAFSCVDDEPSAWNETTSFYANFSNSERRLAAGDSEIIGSIEGYEIYRRKYNESVSEYVGTIQKSENNISDLIIDYAVKNGVDYTYYLFPNADATKSGAPLSPLITKQLSIDVPYWSLFIVDETDEENVFYLDKLFKFELNLQVGDMTNNTQVAISQNFTKYPTIQYGSSNYWSSSLSSLCGFTSSNGVDYIHNVNMLNELKSLSSDTRRKFLKDTCGNLWEVNVGAPITITTMDTALQNVKTWTFPWIEVGDSKGVSIINNPTKKTTDWVLTESGEAIPYFTYQWGDQYRWDNSYMWTANDNIGVAQAKNLGRDITE